MKLNEMGLAKKTYRNRAKIDVEQLAQDTAARILKMVEQETNNAVIDDEGNLHLGVDAMAHNAGAVARALSSRIHRILVAEIYREN